MALRWKSVDESVRFLEGNRSDRLSTCLPCAGTHRLHTEILLPPKVNNHFFCLFCCVMGCEMRSVDPGQTSWRSLLGGMVSKAEL